MRRKLLIALGILAALGLATVGFAYWQTRSVLAQLQAGAKAPVVKAVEKELHRQPKHRLVQAPAEVDAQTILLIGSDHRWSDGGDARSDTIMLVRVEPSKHRIALLSIPRDLYVAIPGHGHDRINEAFHDGGERLLTRVVRETFGVEIDHFVEVDFHGFKGLVNALGGVYLPIDQRYYNRNVGTPGTNYANIDLKPGYQELDGSQALAFARFRHTDNDFVRAARQQLLLRVAGRQALASGWDLFRIRRLALAFAHATASDISSTGELLGLARAIHDTPSGNLDRYTVPARDYVRYGADYLRATPAQLRHVVAAWLGARSQSQAANEALAEPTPSKRPAHPPVRLVRSPGARALAAAHSPIRTCTPRKLPPRFSWPSGAARSYVLDGHPAVALYATAHSGDSVLWMFTTWKNVPILADPSRTTTRGGRTYRVYSAAGHVREVAWRIGPTQAWITNTLRNALTNRQMLALAESCR